MTEPEIVDHETHRTSREEALGAAVLLCAMGTGDVTVHHEGCGDPDTCSCEAVTIHINHAPDECEE